MLHIWTFPRVCIEENKCKPLNFLSRNLNKNNNKNGERKQQSNQHSFHPLERRITLLSSTVSMFLDAKVFSGNSGVNGRWVAKWQVKALGWGSNQNNGPVWGRAKHGTGSHNSLPWGPYAVHIGPVWCLGVKLKPDTRLIGRTFCGTEHWEPEIWH